MSGEPRKATDVLLELENKVDVLINLVKSLTLNNQIISNKLNDMMGIINKQPNVNAPKITVEAVSPANFKNPIDRFQVSDPERQVVISTESNLPETDSPQGFRRTSRPETFEGETSKSVPKNQDAQIIVPHPQRPPPGREKELNVPVQHLGKEKSPIVQNAIPVMQRITDKNGKAIFLADVEIIDAETSQSIFKTRTNGQGRWMASLSVGNYRVTIRKGEALNKSKQEAVQDVRVTGNQSPLDLPVLIIKDI